MRSSSVANARRALGGVNTTTVVRALSTRMDLAPDGSAPVTERRSVATRHRIGYAERRLPDGRAGFA